MPISWNGRYLGNLHIYIYIYIHYTKLLYIFVIAVGTIASIGDVSAGWFHIFVAISSGVDLRHLVGVTTPRVE